MGILTLLRNAFGRSRKGRAAEAEGAVRTPSQTTPQPTATTTPQVPEPRVATSEQKQNDEHDLVSAAFDNVTVPKPEAPEAVEPTEPEATPEPVATSRWRSCASPWACRTP